MGLQTPLKSSIVIKSSEVGNLLGFFTYLTVFQISYKKRIKKFEHCINYNE